MMPSRAPFSPSADRNAVYIFGISPTACAVTGSFGSYPAITSRSSAASLTVRAIGPSVSVLGFAGIMPKRLTSGTVGRRPTRLCTAAGPRVDPPVSSAIASVEKLAATPAPLPLEDPLALRRGS